MDNKKMHSALRSVKVVKVISVIEARGSGTDDDPVRLWNNYYDMNGIKIGEAPVTSLSD